MGYRGLVLGFSYNSPSLCVFLFRSGMLRCPGMALEGQGLGSGVVGWRSDQLEGLLLPLHCCVALGESLSLGLRVATCATKGLERDLGERHQGPRGARRTRVGQEAIG